MSLNQELADLFKTMAAVAQIKGLNPFKAIAFEKVSRTLKETTLDVRKLHEAGELERIEGAGEGSRGIIREYVETGRSTEYDELVSGVPPGLLPMLRLQGLGPKTVGLLWKERGVTSLDELSRAIETGALEGVRGIGKKKIEAIREAIRFAASHAERLGIAEVLPSAESLLEQLRGVDGVKQARIAGSLRRGRETIGGVDLVCSLRPGASGQTVASAFAAFPEVERVLGRGETKASIVTTGGLQAQVRIVPPDSFGAALLYFTGSKEHNVKLRGLAQQRGMTLNEWGLYKLAKKKAEKPTGGPPAGKPVAGRTEGEIYEALGLPFIEPELREDRGEIEAGFDNSLPKLIEQSDIRGDLHSHTTASDGTASIEEMAQAAMALGYEYLAITDHSQSQVIANGLNVDRLKKHLAAIRAADQRIRGIRLLAGAEVDILADGRLDYPDDVLAGMDIVVASPHAALKQSADKATDRLLRAIDKPWVHIIGHPTGRRINQREGLPLDFEKIFRAAADSGTALEINAGYPRLDLNDVHARAAARAGVTLAINTDAHSPAGLSDLPLGLTVARRAWLAAENVLNTLPLKRLEQWLKQKSKIA